MALARSHNDLLEDARARVGEVLERKWTLRDLLGAGGVAAVFEATHRNHKRVAIKALHAHLAHDATVRERFLREAYVANSIGHPAIVEIDDDGQDADGRPFLVMELVAGVTLEEHRNASGGTLGAAELLPAIAQLLDVLVAAHAQGVVHRDLKPDNLMLTAKGEIRVLDFGLARALQFEPEQQLTQPGSVLGTPNYMAPEQALGRWDLVDERTDVWAVGAVLFHSLTGRAVHRGHTAQETLALAGTAHAPSLEDELPEAPPELVAFVDRALVYGKADRYQDAEAMLIALRDEVAPALQVALPDSRERPSVTRVSVAVAPAADISHTRALQHADTIVSQEEPAAPQKQRVQWLPLVLAGLLGSALVWGMMGWRSQPAAPNPAMPAGEASTDNGAIGNIPAAAVKPSANTSSPSVPSPSVPSPSVPSATASGTLSTPSASALTPLLPPSASASATLTVARPASEAAVPSVKPALPARPLPRPTAPPADTAKQEPPVVQDPLDIRK